MHEGRFGVEPRGHGVLRFIRPDGGALCNPVPRVALEGCPLNLFVQANRARGLHIDA